MPTMHTIQQQKWIASLHVSKDESHKMLSNESKLGKCIWYCSICRTVQKQDQTIWLGVNICSKCREKQKKR